MYPGKLFRVKKFFFNLFFTKKLNLTKNVNFGSKIASIYFSKKLKKSKFYFEYGSGSSTLLAKHYNKNFISIEADYNFFKKLKTYDKDMRLLYFSLGPTIDFSYPLLILNKKILKYVMSINNFIISKNCPDLILIDGRFRNACCLNLLRFSKMIHKKKIKIILDDYGDRNHYKILRNYFHIYKVGRLAILNPKSKINLKINIKDYLKDPR